MSPSFRVAAGPLCPHILGLRAPSGWDGGYCNTVFARIAAAHQAGARALGLEISRAAYADAAPYMDPYRAFAGLGRAHHLSVIPLLSDRTGWLRAAHWFAEPYRGTHGCFDVDRLDGDISRRTWVEPGWYRQDRRWKELQMARRVIEQARTIVAEFDRECAEALRGCVHDALSMLSQPNVLRSGLLLVDRDVGIRVSAQLPGANFEELV